MGQHPPQSPTLVGWSDIHLSNYHLSIRTLYTLTPNYLVLQVLFKSSTVGTINTWQLMMVEKCFGRRENDSLERNF